MECKEKLLARDDPQVRLHAVLKTDAGLGIPVGGDLRNSLHGGKPIHDRGGLGGSNQEVKVPHRLHAPAQAAGGLHPLNLRQGFKAGQDAVRHPSRLPPEVAGGIGLAILDPRKDFLLGLLAKALELSHLSLVAGLGKGID